MPETISKCFPFMHLTVRTFLWGRYYHFCFYIPTWGTENSHNTLPTFSQPVRGWSHIGTLISAVLNVHCYVMSFNSAAPSFRHQNLSGQTLGTFCHLYGCCEWPILGFDFWPLWPVPTWVQLPEVKLLMLWRGRDCLLFGRITAFGLHTEDLK